MSFHDIKFLSSKTNIPDIRKLIKEYISDIKKQISNYKIINEKIKSEEITIAINKIYERIKEFEQQVKQIEKCVKITLTGSFSSGKSTFIKSLLNVDIPKGIDPTTHAVTHLISSNTDCVKDINNNIISMDEYKERVVVENKDDNIFTIEQKERNFKNVDFVDTPGFNSGREYDKKLSLNTACESDVIFFIFSTPKGIRDSEIKFIKKIYEESNNKKYLKLYLIMNQADKKFIRDEGVYKLENIKNDIRKTLKKEKIKCEVIFIYSSKVENIEDYKKDYFIKRKEELEFEINKIAEIIIKDKIIQYFDKFESYYAKNKKLEQIKEIIRIKEIQSYEKSLKKKYEEKQEEDFVFIEDKTKFKPYRKKDESWLWHILGYYYVDFHLDTTESGDIYDYVLKYEYLFNEDEIKEILEKVKEELRLSGNFRNGKQYYKTDADSLVKDRNKRFNYILKEELKSKIKTRYENQIKEKIKQFIEKNNL